MGRPPRAGAPELLTEVELELMTILWKLDEATVQELDELKIVPHSPQTIPVAGEDSRLQEEKNTSSRTLDFLNRISGLRPPSFGRREMRGYRSRA